MFIKWNPIYSVNVKEIDDQHKQIVTLINSVHDAKINSIEECKNCVSKFVQELKKHSVIHFRTEEKYFQQ